MSEFVEVKTADLVGLPLHWAVALADRGAENMPSPWQFKVWDDYLPSVCWDECGKLIDKYIGAMSGPTAIRSYSIACVKGSTTAVWGKTIPIAVCRAIVYAKLGQVVQVPKVLLEDAE